MFKKQEIALKKLRRAFKKCKEANIVFFGCDYSLFAMDGKRYNKLDQDNINHQEMTIPDIGREIVKKGGWTEEVDTSETYIDSGGA